MDYTKARVTQVSGVEALSYDRGLRDYMVAIYRQMAIALLITGVTSFLIGNSPALLSAIFGTPLYLVVLLAPIAISFYMSARLMQLSVEKARNMLWLYSALLGVSMSILFQAFTTASITRAFFLAAVMFGGMGIYGYSAKKDLSSLGSFMMMGVWGVVLASLVNLFMRSDMMSFVISVVTVVAFTGLTAYETQKLRNMYYQVAGGADDVERTAVYGALCLYLNFINIFVSLLRLTGSRRD